MSKYQGDYPVGQLVYVYFNTNDATGTPASLLGSPTLSVYRDADPNESAVGMSAISVNFDSKTGLAVATITTTADPTFYAIGHDYFVFIAAGTVSGVIEVGAIVAHFSIQNRYMRGTDAAYTGTPPTPPSAAAISAVVSPATAALVAAGNVANVTGNVGGNVAGNVTGNIGGKVLGGGSGTITAIGAQVAASGTVDANVVTWLGDVPNALSNGSIPVNVVGLATGTVQAGSTSTSIVLTGSDLGTTSGLYTGRRLYIALAVGGKLLTDVCMSDTYASGPGTHTFAFMSAQKAIPAAGDVARVVGA